MLIKSINKKDLYQIEMCGASSLPIYYSLSDLLFLLYDSSYIMYKVTINDKICGFLIGKKYNKRIHIMSLAINKLYRRKSVGTNLINQIKLKYNNYIITLNVLQTNKEAISFYLKNNFFIERELINYYENLVDKNAYKMKYIHKL